MTLLTAVHLGCGEHDVVGVHAGRGEVLVLDVLDLLVDVASPVAIQEDAADAETRAKRIRQVFVGRINERLTEDLSLVTRTRKTRRRCPSSGSTPWR